MHALPRLCEAHLWSASRLELSSCTPDLWGMLSPDEQAAANRLLKPIDRQRAVFGRAMLRTLLGSYLGLDPSSLLFSYGAHGKPSLDLAHPQAPAFSLSRSGDDVLVAVGAAGSQIGVDLEQHRAIPEWLDIATHHFHAEEVMDLLALPPSRQLKAFFDCWTSKEAVVKAVGLGLSLDLRSFRVPLRTEHPECLVTLPGVDTDRPCVLLTGMSRAPHCAAALACWGAGRNFSICHRSFVAAQWLN